LKIKDLRDVGKSLKIKHLLKFFAVLQSTAKPTYQARRPATRWHDFCRQDPCFFYTLSRHLNMLNKNSKTFENQGLEPLSKSLSMR
jgi:hypothetical protein